MEKVCQTRMLLIAVLGSIIIMIIFKSEKNINKKILITICICIVTIIILNSDIMHSFFDSFYATENLGSVSARQEELQYYIKKIILNPINAMGLINDDINSNLYYVLHGQQGYLFTTDVGIIGMCAILGGFGVIWYIVLIYKMIKLCFVYKRRLLYCLENIGLLAFVCFTSFTLIITDPQRIILLPLIMFIIEYNYNKLNVK